MFAFTEMALSAPTVIGWNLASSLSLSPRVTSINSLPPGVNLASPVLVSALALRAVTPVTRPTRINATRNCFIGLPRIKSYAPAAGTPLDASERRAQLPRRLVRQCKGCTLPAAVVDCNGRLRDTVEVSGIQTLG